MPDISLCSNNNCPLRKGCYRATAIPSDFLQSYTVFNLNEDGTCNWFWDNKEYENKNKKDEKVQSRI